MGSLEASLISISDLSLAALLRIGVSFDFFWVLRGMSDCYKRVNM